MSAAPFVFQSRIRFVDTDASGRIHFAAMLRHFEAAEEEFLRRIGCPYQSIEDRKMGYPRVHVECDYLAALRYDDVAAIEVRVERVGNSSFTLGFLVRRDGEDAAKGKIVVVAMDRESGRSRALPEKLAEILRQRMGE